MAKNKQRGRSQNAPTPRRRGRIVAWGGLVVALAFLAWMGSRLMSPAGTPASTVDANSLNLLLITVDTTRADFLGCYGRESARTPVIDRLASDGARFTQCRSCTPLTLPSHSTIMTGTYPFVHGVRQNGTGRLVAGNTTLAELLSDAGYATQATVAAFVLNRKFGVSQGFDVYHDVVPAGIGDPLKAERKGGEIREDALRMLDSLADRPFFLWVHFFDPHHPYESTLHTDPVSREAYEDEIAFMDTQIGGLIKRLNVLGIDGKTLVVLVGDHGEGLFDHGEPRHGLYLYDTTLHVPLVMRCPGVINPGTTISANVRTIDVVPTVLDLLGYAASDPVQGVSLVPLLNGEVDDMGLRSYAETFEAQVNYGASQLRSLLVGGWKYILSPAPELYDLSVDATEISDRVDDEPERAADLREQLRRVIANAPPMIGGGGDGEMTLEASEIAKLESLGYVVSGARPSDLGMTELDRFEPRGANPRDIAPIMTSVARARSAIRAGRSKQAEAMLRGLIARAPDATRLLADLADAIASQGRVDEAVATYDRAVAAAPQDRYILRKYGRYLVRTGRLEAALKQYVAMLRGMPDDTTALHEIGIALVRLGRFAEAEKHLQLALREEPNTPRLLHAMGFLRWNEQRFPEAAEYFRRTLRIDPNFEASKDALQKLRQAQTARPDGRP